MSSSLITPVNRPLVYSPSTLSDNSEDPAIINIMHQVFATKCIKNLKEDSFVTIPYQIKMEYPISKFSGVLRGYLIGKGYSKTDKVEVALNYKDIMSRIEEAVEEAIKESWYTYNPHSNSASLLGNKYTLI